MISPTRVPAILLMLALILFSAGFAAAVEKPSQGKELLLKTYHKTRTKLDSSSFGLPLYLESVEHNDRVHVDVYGLFDYPFSKVANVLTVPANWCAIVPLHPNVKACTYKELPDTWTLTFYLGRKFYQPPEDAKQVNFQYRNTEQQQGYLNILLKAEEGPFATKDHKMRFEALAVDEATTFVHVSYTYSDSVALRLATKVYFATLGHSKVGFTVTGTDRNGKPVYIGGPRGSIERNAVRYYFAIQTFMHTSHYPEATRFSASINEWYDLTARYKKQLFDLDKKDYLTFKTAEHKNQLLLQQQIRLALK